MPIQAISVISIFKLIQAKTEPDTKVQEGFWISKSDSQKLRGFVFMYAAKNFKEMKQVFNIYTPLNKAKFDDEKEFFTKNHWTSNMTNNQYWDLPFQIWSQEPDKKRPDEKVFLLPDFLAKKLKTITTSDENGSQTKISLEDLNLDTNNADKVEEGEFFVKVTEITENTAKFQIKKMKETDGGKKEIELIGDEIELIKLESKKGFDEYVFPAEFKHGNFFWVVLVIITVAVCFSFIFLLRRGIKKAI